MRSCRTGAPRRSPPPRAEHLAAGADHVCLQTVGITGVPRAQWTALAGALGLGR